MLTSFGIIILEQAYLLISNKKIYLSHVLCVIIIQFIRNDLLNNILCTVQYIKLENRDTLNLLEIANIE